jgi:hypothetical protein
MEEQEQGEEEKEGEQQQQQQQQQHEWLDTLMRKSNIHKRKSFQKGS